jgi:hypothetical protein
LSALHFFSQLSLNLGRLLVFSLCISPSNQQTPLIIHIATLCGFSLFVGQFFVYTLNSVDALAICRIVSEYPSLDTDPVP